MNWKVRMRNPWFWVGIVSAVVSALRVDVNALTSWGAVWSCLAGILEFSPGVHGAYDRSDGVRITQGKNQHQHHDVVDKACGGQ